VAWIGAVAIKVLRHRLGCTYTRIFPWITCSVLEKEQMNPRLLSEQYRKTLPVLETSKTRNNRFRL
jgi:hypothetical protein